MSGLEIAMFAASTALSAGGQLMQGGSDRRAAYRSAAEAEAEAQRAANAAAIDASLAQADAERAIGTALTQAGASGFAIDGSAVDVLADLGAQKRYNTSTIIYGGDLERRRLLTEAKNMRRAGDSAFTQGVLGAAGTVLSGGYRARQSQLDRAATRTTTPKATQRRPVTVKPRKYS